VLFIGEVISVDASDELFDRQRGAWRTEKIKSILRVAYDTYTTTNMETLSQN
jgi:flavin reductase (DIM6/NTAB) family NADH-FMN oxidoreductase RutF